MKQKRIVDLRRHLGINAWLMISGYHKNASHFPLKTTFSLKNYKNLRIGLSALSRKFSEIAFFVEILAE
jgi:hypothetical protein